MRGRPSFLETNDISQEQLLEMFSLTPEVKVLAKKLHVSEKTLRKHLHEAGVDFKSPERPKFIRIHKDFSVFAEWLRAHPTEKLPKSVLEISKRTGFSVDTIKCYLYRRKQVNHKRWKRALAKYLRGKTEVTLNEKILIPSKVKKYILRVERFSGDLNLMVITTADIRKKYFLPYRFLLTLEEK
jgi:hypothetical protein